LFSDEDAQLLILSTWGPSAQDHRHKCSNRQGPN